MLIDTHAKNFGSMENFDVRRFVFSFNSKIKKTSQGSLLSREKLVYTLTVQSHT